MSRLQKFQAPDLNYDVNHKQKESIQDFLQVCYSNKDFISYLHGLIQETNSEVLRTNIDEQDRMYWIGRSEAIVSILKDIDWAIKKSLIKK
jgi:hypothetical protein